MSLIPIQRIDNRDFNTTRLYLNETDYVEIDPIQLYDNTITNWPNNAALEELKVLVTTRSTGWDDIRDWEPRDYRERLQNCDGWEGAHELFMYVQWNMFGTDAD